MINFSCLEFFSSGLLLQGSWRELIMLLFLLNERRSKWKCFGWSLLQHWNQGCSHSTVDNIQYMCNHGFWREELWGKVWQILSLCLISPDLTTKSCSNGRRINICNWELWLSVIHLTGNHVLVNWELTKKCIYIPCCNPSSLGNEKLFSLLSFLIVPSVLPVALCFSEIDKLNPIHLINFYILTLRFELIELKVGIYQCGLF